MKYLSLCSGIEAATVAWHPLGWEAVAYSEIERFPSEVLAHHYPSTPNLGDMTKFKEWNLESNVDLLVGGTPCQSFSVAGLRKGLDDPRGNLMLTYLAIADKYRPRWLVWENVPGVLSSNGGKDFGVFLGALGELGYGFAYRILDAQYFGVAQRRRRVFVVGYLGDWRLAAAVLFERHSLSGHPAPSREKRKGVTASTGTGASVGSLCARTGQSISVQDAAQGHLMPIMHSELCPALKARDAKGPSSDGDGDGAILVPMLPAYGIPGNWIGRKPENGGNATEPMHDVAPCLTKADQHGVAQPVYEMHGQDSRVRELGDVCTTVSATYGTGGGNVPVTLQPIAFSGQMSNPQTDVDMTQTLQAKNPMAVCLGGQHPNAGIGIDQSPTLTNAMGAGGGHVPVTTQTMAVRRLTPVECERLQGFPDNYTDIKSKNKPTPDGPRYKALGNSMAVPVMAWIGQRIQEVEAICKQNK